MDTIKAVIFDIGNVLIEWDPRFLYEKLITDPGELDFFLSEVVTLEWHTEHDRGRSFKDGIDILSAKYPEYADLIALYDDRWFETLGAVIDGTVHILEQLADRKIPCYGLTNFSAEKYPDFARANAFTDYFESVVVSGREGLIKPDPRIFQVAMDRFGLDPEQTLFIDDRPNNVAAAEQLNIKGHVFRGADALAAAMRALGLL